MPAPRRVLLIHNYLTPYRVPFFAELARRFDLDVWILGDISKLREWKGETQNQAFNYRNLPQRTIGFGSRYISLVVNPTLRRELNKGTYEAIIVCGWDTPAAFYTAWWTRRNAVPLVLWAGSTPAEDTLLRRVTRTAVSRLVRAADAWTAYGSRAGRYLVSLGADDERIFHAYNTVDIPYFQQQSAHFRKEIGELKDQLAITTPFVIMFCGNLVPLKGLPDLLNAFHQLHNERGDVTLLIVGSGEHQHEYQSLAATLAIDGRVHFTGYVPPEDLPRYYATADLLCLPSHSEVWGLVVNEALACGVPAAVSSAAGASEDLITHGRNGYIFPRGDIHALAEILRSYFADSTDREAMRRRAADSIQPYTIPAMADAFERAVESALEQRS